MYSPIYSLSYNVLLSRPKMIKYYVKKKIQLNKKKEKKKKLKKRPTVGCGSILDHDILI